MKKKLLTIVAILLLVIIGGFVGLSSFIIDIQWFNEVGYESVLWTRIFARLVIFIPIFLVMFISLSVYGNILMKNYKKSKVVKEINVEGDKKLKRITKGIILLVSLLMSITLTSAYWYDALTFLNSTDFNVADPVFNKDVSFYMFKLPFLNSIYSLVFNILILMVLLTGVFYLATNLLSGKKIGNINIENISAKEFISAKNPLKSFAGKQLAIVVSLIFITLAAGYVLKGYGLVYSGRGVVLGISYTDKVISLNFYKVISIVSIIASVIVFISVLRGKIKPIVFAIVALFALIIAEPIVSELYDNLYVKPNQRDLESKYIKNNIEMTQNGFNINDIEVKDVKLGDNLDGDAVLRNMDTINNLKINSFYPALKFFNQAQTMRSYYDFEDIDVDRYEIDGKMTQVFITPREINIEGLQGNADSWQGKHLLYTHGYGLAMSRVNSITDSGRPDFVMKDVPINNATDINLENPRIYFGEKTKDYAIVNTTLKETDYPEDGKENTYDYTGKAGIKLNFLNKLLFAINKGDYNMMISSNINSDSKILINRNIIDRVNKIAPFLTLDEDPYPVISEGRIKWIIDAYTTSNLYPLAERYDGINYIRNSIKIVIDGYNGSVDFYIVDNNDPIAVTYSKIYKGLFKDSSKMPEDIKNHLKYPQHLFDLQSEVLGRYHVEDANVFFSKGDLWDVSELEFGVENNEEKAVKEGDYVTFKLPGEEKEEMVIVNYLNPSAKKTMAAIFAGRMDGDNYGKLMLLRLPTDTSIESPQFFKNTVQQDTTISKEITLLNSNGSSVEYGEILIVPIENSLLYAMPIYVESTGNNSVPEVKRIILANGNKIVMGESVSDALNQLFNIDTSSNVTIIPEEKKDNVFDNEDEKALAKKANEKFNEMIEAQKNGDWAKYGQLQKEVGDIISELSK